MAELTDKKREQLFGLLGLARRSGKLLIGQDQVITAVKTGARMLVITAEDISAAVLRSLNPAEEKGSILRITINGVDRAMLGRSVGITSTQIAALPLGHGFARKILNIFDDGSDADE